MSNRWHIDVSGPNEAVEGGDYYINVTISISSDPSTRVFQWDGASIPVISVIREASGAAPLMVGWGQSEDRIHSPNESYSFRQFDTARDWAKRILSAL